MSTQNYHNHRRYYIPHHFIFLPAMAFYIVLGIVKASNNEPRQLEWTLFSILSFAQLYLGLMLLQHYAPGNQNRIVHIFINHYRHTSNFLFDNIMPRFVTKVFCIKNTSAVKWLFWHLFSSTN